MHKRSFLKAALVAATALAALVVLSLIGVILFWILDVLERISIPWHASQRQDLILGA